MRYQRALASAVATFSVAAASVVVAEPAAAATTQWAWAYANQPTTSSYFTPGGNSTSNRNQSVRTGTGAYTVYFRGLGGVVGGNVAVTAEGGNAGGHCKVGSWGPTPNGNQAADIRCFTLSGSPVDSAFYATFVAKSGTESGRYAYLWTDRPDATTGYAPDPTYSYNSRGAVNRMTHPSVGRYVARLPRQAVDGGTVKVTAYGYDATYCTVASSLPNSAGTQQLVDVRCFDAAGAPANSAFTLLFTHRRHLLGLGGRPSGYLFADQPFATAPYTPDGRYSFNSTGRTNAVEPHLITDTARFRGLGSALAGAHVTPFSTGPAMCKVAFQNRSSSTDKTVDVFCYDTSNRAIDMAYNVQVFR
jgi:hypothetical protein